MKEIKAIVQPFKLEDVLDALHSMPELPGCTVSQVQGYSRISGPETDEDIHAPKPMTKLEIVVPDRLAEKVLAAIRQAAHTGNRGDGKIFVIDLADAVSIRTGKSGEKTL